LTIRNKGPRTLHHVVGHVCLGHLSEAFRDPRHDRTYIRHEGALLNLAETDRGTDPIRAHYRVRRQKPIKIFDTPDNRFWGPLSPEFADDGLIVTRAADDRRLVALWFDPASELFQNSDEPNMCIHSDPVFGDLEPNQSVQVRGKLILFEGSLEEFAEADFN